MKKQKHKCHFPKLHKLANEIKKLTEKERKEGKRNFDKEHFEREGMGSPLRLPE